MDSLCNLQRTTELVSSTPHRRISEALAELSDAVTRLEMVSEKILDTPSASSNDRTRSSESLRDILVHTPEVLGIITGRINTAIGAIDSLLFQPG